MSDAIISAGASLLGGAFNNLFSTYNANKQVNAQKKLMDYQNELNIANWERSNAYNSPSAQMARLKSAGINPDLFYANGASGIVSGEIPSVSAGSASMANTIPTDFGSAYNNASLLDSQKKLLDSQTAKNNAEADATNKTTPWVTEEIKSRLHLNDANAKMLNENVEKIRNESELLKWQAQVSKYDSEILSAVKDSRIGKEIAESKASQEQSRVIYENFAKYYELQLKLAMAQSYAAYVQSDAARDNAVTNRYNAETNRLQYSLDENIRNLETQLHKTEVQIKNELKDLSIDSLKFEVANSLRKSYMPTVADMAGALSGIASQAFRFAF